MSPERFGVSKVLSAACGALDPLVAHLVHGSHVKRKVESFAERLRAERTVEDLKNSRREIAYVIKSIDR